MSDIPKTLKDLTVPIDTLTPYDRNPRQGDIGAITQSLEAHGQYRPVVVNKPTMQILAGNHTWRAAKALGWDQLAVTFVDVDEETAARIVLVDNRTNDLATYDDVLLSEMLEELVATSEGLDGSGFDEDALNQLLADLGAGLSWGVLADLGGGGEMETMTFTFAIEDGHSIREALDTVRAEYGEGPTTNRNGQALVALARRVT